MRLLVLIHLFDNVLCNQGSNTYGQSTPPKGKFAQLSAGGWHTIGMLSNGTWYMVCAIAMFCLVVVAFVLYLISDFALDTCMYVQGGLGRCEH